MSATVKTGPPTQNDDWDTDPDFVNDIGEKQGRWGSKTVEGSGHLEDVKMSDLRETAMKNAEMMKERTLKTMPKPSEGYGGKFGVQSDRKDKCAEDWSYKGQVDQHFSQKDYKQGFGGQFGVDKEKKDSSAFGWDEKETLAKHASQKDYSTGFGGTYGVQKDRVDKCALGWDSNEKTEKHGSQTDYKTGFGGQFGVQTDRKDKSAVGWNERDKLTQHASQTDYKKGFGGDFGVQTDRKDQSAVGWDHQEKVEPHESQKDYKKGFGGQFGVQKDRKDKAAFDWSEKEGANSCQQKNGSGEKVASIQKGSASNLRNKFEQMNLQQQSRDQDKVNEERERRKREDEELRKRQVTAEQERQQKLDSAEPVNTTSNSNDVAEPEPIDPFPREQKKPTSTKNRPHFGVALPYAVQQPKQEESNEDVDFENMAEPIQSVDESEVPIPAPVKVLPTPVLTGTYVPPVPEENQAASVPTAPIEKHNSMVNDDFEESRDNEWEDSPQVPSSQGVVAEPEPQQIDLPVEPHQQPSLGIQQQEQTTQSLTAIALYSYDKSDDDEIGFDVDDIITDIEQIDAGWWRGTCNGMYGLFPANYVQIVDESNRN